MAEKAVKPGKMPQKDADLEYFNERLGWALENEDAAEVERAMEDRKAQNWGRKVDD